MTRSHSTTLYRFVLVRASLSTSSMTHCTISGRWLKTERPRTSYPVFENHYNSPLYVGKIMLMKEWLDVSHCTIRLWQIVQYMAKSFFEIERDKDDIPIKLNESSLGDRSGFNKKIFMNYFDLNKSKSLTLEEIKTDLF
ncbi:hypothetical protein PV327_004926 [Microctonus hyperodae]|uniref:EF-hand domain-containing protein n=1 Tax=Microctonus hyperodae TaxID=165561 RepID=A0AA39FDJ5_MICHY|nr:hypothetical protein PV327_004926 [Microctonus hyperodae]